jgi:lantibiotic modifying enzyme
MTTQSPASIRTAVVATLFALFSLFSVSGHADNLSEQKVSAFINSLKAAERLEPEFEDLGNEMDNGNAGAMPDFSRLFSDSLGQLKGHEAYSHLEDIARDHGFNNLEQWAATGDRVFQAWMAIEMEQQNPAAQQEMNAALAEIENSPNMTPEQKAQMRAMMQGAMGAMESASNAPAADIAAVRPHINALRALSE